MLHDRTRLKKLKTASYQIIIILAVWSCADVLQKLLNLPVASGVLGFFLLLFLLEMKWFKLAHVERGADLLLAELLLAAAEPLAAVLPVGVRAGVVCVRLSLVVAGFEAVLRPASCAGRVGDVALFGV